LKLGTGAGGLTLENIKKKKNVDILSTTGAGA
jgi:hypothetical protein